MVQNRLDRPNLSLYSLILLDYSMPEMDGFQCVQAIKETIKVHQNHTLEFVPQPYLCCVTAYQQEKFLENARNAGFDSVLIKPIFKSKL